MINRREMIRKSGLMAGGICFCHKLLADDGRKSDCCFTPDIEAEAVTVWKDAITIDLQKSELLREVGHAVYLDHVDKNVKMIIVHFRDNEYLALSRLCTHGGQALSYIKERELLQCNSYNHSIFGMDGVVWKGPAPTDIQTYELTLKGNQVEIKMGPSS